MMFTQRKKGLVFTDKRVRITTEVLQGIRLIKFYAWEAFYVQHIGLLRKKEVQAIRMSAYVAFSIMISWEINPNEQFSSMARSGLVAFLTYTPILAYILSFVRHENALFVQMVIDNSISIRSHTP